MRGSSSSSTESPGRDPVGFRIFSNSADFASRDGGWRGSSGSPWDDEDEEDIVRAYRGCVEG